VIEKSHNVVGEKVLGPKVGARGGEHPEKKPTVPKTVLKKREGAIRPGGSYNRGGVRGPCGGGVANAVNAVEGKTPPTES